MDDTGKPTENGSIPGENRPIAELICPVVSNLWINDQYKHLIVEANPGAMAVQAGQFFHLLCPKSGDDEPYLRRPMSVYRIDRNQDRIEFLYNVVGLGTQQLAKLEPGDGLDMVGPLGQGFRLTDNLGHLLMVARGVGLSTLAPLAMAAHDHGIRVSAILSARTPEVLMAVDYLCQSGAEVHTVTDRDGTSLPEKVEELARHIIAANDTGLLATCGSNRLLKLLQRLGKELEIPGQVALEQLMACGLGMCYCCVRRIGPEGTYKRVCVDGPVFDLQEVQSWQT